MKLNYSSLACACINKTSLHSYLPCLLFLLKNFRLINFRGFHYPRKIFNNEIFPDYGSWLFYCMLCVLPVYTKIC